MYVFFFLYCRDQRIIQHGRSDGGYVLLADFQRLRQEEVRFAVAQLPRTVSAQLDVLLCDSAARHTVRIPSAHIHHATVQSFGFYQDRTQV